LTDSAAVGARSIASSGQCTVTAAGSRSVASSRVQPSSRIAATVPATMPPAGVMPATSTPPDRATGSSSESKLTASDARASGLISPISLWSIVERTAEISLSPRAVSGGKSDG
jgi:hypothetical protein